MGRYRQHVAEHEACDPAGPYLLAARESRKQSMQQRREAALDKRSKAAVFAGGDCDVNSCTQENLDRLAAENDGDLDTAVSICLRRMPPGSQLLFRGLGKEERSVVHAVAHRLGLNKVSGADKTPGARQGERLIRVTTTQAEAELGDANVETIAPVTQRPLDLPLGATCPSGDVQPVEKRSRWRRRDAVGKSTASDISETAKVEKTPVYQAFAPPPRPSAALAAGAEAEGIDVAGTQEFPIVRPEGGVCIVWLRDDLRLHDNPALLHAVRGGYSSVVLLYIRDEEEQNDYPLRGAAAFWKHESLRAFQQSVAATGGRLTLRRGDAARELLDTIAVAGGSQRRRVVAFNRRHEPCLHARDQDVIQRLERAGVEVQSCMANVLYEPWDVQPIERWQKWRTRVRAEEAAARGLPADSRAARGEQKDLEHISGFGSYRFFHHALEDIGPPARPVATVKRLPPCAKVASLDLEALGYGNTAGGGFTSALRQCRLGSERRSALAASDCGIESGVPSPSTAGVQGDWAAGIRSWWKVGEQVALQRLEVFLERILAGGDFEGRERLLADSGNTSELSPHVRFGELSPRTVYWAAKRHSEKSTKTFYQQDNGRGARRSRNRAAPEHEARANSTFLRRFVWRDLAYWFLWEFPTMPSLSIRTQYETQRWAGTRRQLQRWKAGQTGFPLVDAAMRQLWTVGWMPNYMRHIVAQTLIEYLDLSWKEGLQWFDWTLVDSDVAINSFMWQNGGHSGPDHWEFVLHPVHAAKSCDPQGNYVRKWLPCLADLPREFIHRPWDAPLRLLKTPSLQGYPQRVVPDLDAARRAHTKNVLEVRQRHPEMVSRTGHEWMKLPGRGNLLAKLVTRDEFRAETQDFLLYQSLGRVGGNAHRSQRCDDNRRAIQDAERRHEKTS
eukprot:TRINITY_DN69052_c0_g1_i1.p1 TRINITY_DN69052_c0_g1~~TRINITY_DN69052_c0_g1_i1.p1  ORF type:complete len:900 (+),score=154.66 TRINITY_DN69052_c0_g1_i1:83-2782(+)